MALSKSPLGAHFVSIWTPFSPPGDPSLLSIPSAPFRTPPLPPSLSFLLLLLLLCRFKHFSFGSEGEEEKELGREGDLIFPLRLLPPTPKWKNSPLHGLLVVESALTLFSS